MAKYCSHVHAIEPNATAHKFLSSWTEGRTDITSYNHAVWSEIKELELKEPIINGITRHSLSTASKNFLEFKNIKDWNTFTVQTLRLEDIGFANRSQLTIFKCDIEGAESNILDSLINGFESGAVGMIEVSPKNNPEHQNFLLEVAKVADIFVIPNGGQALERIFDNNIG